MKDAEKSNITDELENRISRVIALAEKLKHERLECMSRSKELSDKLEKAKGEIEKLTQENRKFKEAIGERDKRFVNASERVEEILTKLEHV